MQPAGHRPDQVGRCRLLVVSGLLVLVSGFMPWFSPVDDDYPMTSPGWGSGFLAVMALVLAALLTIAASARLVLSQAPARAGRLLSWDPVLPVIAAGIAVLCILLAWLLPQPATDPALASAVDRHADYGLFVDLVGALGQLAAVAAPTRSARYVG